MSEVRPGAADSRSVIVTKDGKPFGTENAANLARSQKGLSAETHDIVPVDGGFGIKPKYEASKPPPDAPKEGAGASPDGNKYYEVVFFNKRDPNDDEKIKLGCNGPLYIITREVPVILSESYLETARHATYTQWNFDPASGSDRMTPTVTQKYPYRVLREATYQEFMDYWIKTPGARAKS